MDYIYEIIGLLVLIFLIFGFIFLFLHNKKKEDERLADELRNKRKYVKAEVKSAVKVTNNLTSGKVDNSKGIISKINISNESSKEKLAQWIDTESYEDDIKEEKKSITPLAITEENEEEMKKIAIKSLILLVDDSYVVRKYVGDLLRKHNYELVIKNDGWEAITYLNSNSQKPDLIITDIQMPNMDGFQLIEAIRKEKKFKSLPIIVISAHVQAEDHLSLMEDEIIQGFINKPFKDEDLTVQAKYLLDN